jgi:hypothetical protein
MTIGGAGWYPDINGEPVQRYWDGSKWTSYTREAPDYSGALNLPDAPVTATTSDELARYAGILAVLLAGIGIILNGQSVSLAQGAGIVWIGATLTIAGAVIAFAVPRVRRWVGVVCALAAIFAVANGVSVNNQLDEKRQQIQHILDQIPSN